MVLTAREGRKLHAALHGAVTTVATGLFSHPWKMLGSEKPLRLDGGPEPTEVQERRSRRPARAGAKTALTAATRNAVFLCEAPERLIAPDATGAAMDEPARLLENYRTDLVRPAARTAGAPAVSLHEDAR